MKIHSGSAYAAYSYQNISPHQKQTSADVSASFSASEATISDTVAISKAAQSYLADQSNPGGSSGNNSTAIFDTNQGPRSLNIDSYFSPGGSANGTAASFQTLPPLLLPTKNNIDALTKHISANFPQFLAKNNIPAAPSNITYDREGNIQLPSDYAYASEFKQALANNPTMSRQLRTVNALSSHFVGIQKSLQFQQAYATAATQIALQFSESGRLSITQDGKTLS